MRTAQGMMMVAGVRSRSNVPQLQPGAMREFAARLLCV
jgi:hypothetical protein